MHFSVIVPVYKAEAFLDKCVSSILEQTFKDFELILVDDGSPDNCPQMCDAYSKRDNRVKVIHKQNGGSTSSRKAGCKIAAGDYIICIDSDDFINQGYFSKINEIAEKYSPDIIMFSHFDCYENGDTRYNKNLLADGFYDKDSTNTLKSKFLYDPDEPGINYGRIGYSLWSKAIKKDIFTKCQMQIDDRLVIGEDMLCSGKTLFESQTVYSSSKAFYNYRIREDSVMHRADAEIFKKYTDTVVELEKMKNVTPYAISAFAFLSVFSRIKLILKSNDFKTAVKIIEDSLTYKKLWDYAEKITSDKCSLKEKIKVYLFKKKSWLLIKLLSQ